MSHHPTSRSSRASAKRKAAGDVDDDESSDEELLAEARVEPARHDKHRRNLPISNKASATTAVVEPASPKVAASNNNKRSIPLTTASATPTKRKPYRRTKRPKNYNDKSTITTCTPTVAKEKPNVYDTVLGEAEDLLRAATDNQSLGRLKMASNYLLLLHARLVGLGKKFDRSQTAPSLSSTIMRKSLADGDEDDEEPSKLKPTKLDLSPERNRGNSKEDDEEEDDNDHHNHEEDTESEERYEDADEDGASTTEDDTNTNGGVPKTPPKQKPQVPPSNGISEAALNQLTNYLPSNIEMDQAMVEHLARAAAELHQKRTGKKFSEEGLLNSPAMNTEEVFHYNKEPYDGQYHQYPYNPPAPSPTPTAAHSKRKGKMVAAEITAGATGSASSSPNDDNDDGTPAINTTNFYTAKNTAPEQAAPVAWTQDERERFQAASRCTSDPARIASLMGTRNEVQVRAYLNNAAEMEKGVAAMEKEMLDDNTPRKRGGRGRKPPTTAMNTVPNANVDAKSMLHGCSVGMI